MLTVGAIAAPSASVNPSPSPSPVVSVVPTEPPVQVQTPVSTTKAPAPKQVNVSITNVSLTCDGGSPPKVKLTATVTTSIPLYMFTVKTNIYGMMSTVIHPFVTQSDTIRMEGEAPGQFEWSLSADVDGGSGGKWSKTMPSQKNPCWA